MSARDRKEFEYRRDQELAALDDDQDEQRTGRGRRMEQQALWVDQQIRAAMARGEFDDLPGSGKPIPGLDRPHDPDWWVKRLIERENIGGAGVPPEALAIRVEDAQLDERLDRLGRESDVREALETFNRRVVAARRQLQGGPPVVTPLRDVDDDVDRWRARRDARATAAPPPVDSPRRQGKISGWARALRRRRP